jgi:hypothetical protein
VADERGADATTPENDAARRARVSAVRGEVLVEGAPLVLGAVLRAGSWVTVPADAEMSFDFPGHARVDIDGNSRFALSPTSPATVLLARGAARLRLPPSGGGARQPLRAVTPDFAIVVPGSGEAFVAVTSRPPGTRAFGLAGLVELQDGTVDPGGVPTVRTLEPGQSRRAVTGQSERGVSTVQAARAAVGRERRGIRPSALVAARAAFETCRERARATLAEVARADAASRAASAAAEDVRRQALSALVLATQRRERARAALRVAWERVLAAAAMVELQDQEPAGTPGADVALLPTPTEYAEVESLLGEDARPQW